MSSPARGDLFDDVHQLRSRNLPIGWILLDNPWEQGAAHGCYGSLTFDRSAYPDPKATIARIHRLGVRFMLWISPQIARGPCPVPSLPDGYLTGNDRVFVRDLSNPGERAEFTRDLRRLVALGVDGFKGDRGDEINLEPDRLVGGSGTTMQNAYTRLYAESIRQAFAGTRGAAYATLDRTFGYGAGPLLPGAVGPDEPQTYTGLSGAIRAAQTEGFTGAVVWGSDVGGYVGGSLTPTVFVRWAQFAALTPIFEVGGGGENATFWNFGADTVSQFAAAATLHYELVPYLYELAREATTTALPVVRPLGLTWPGDPRAWSHDGEFTVGDALLAAPLTSDDQYRRCTSRGARGSTSSPVAACAAARPCAAGRVPRRSRSTCTPARRSHSACARPSFGARAGARTTCNAATGRDGSSRPRSACRRRPATGRRPSPSRPTGAARPSSACRVRCASSSSSSWRPPASVAPGSAAPC
ncbi:MAG TPA: TIM-barrel domain-containing protein [Gaiellaceae bacterium]|nr:TIM-barrel domain-containing protein [Gaiellaceae bacterium]